MVGRETGGEGVETGDQHADRRQGAQEGDMAGGGAGRWGMQELRQVANQAAGNGSSRWRAGGGQHGALGPKKGT